MYILIGALLLISVFFIGNNERKSTPEIDTDYNNKSNYYKSSWQRLGRWKTIRKNKP